MNRDRYLPCVFVCLGIALHNLHAQAQDYAHFKLEGLPDQTVWFGSSRTFLVSSSTGSALSMTVATPPKGPVSLQATPGTNWLFNYTPDIDDIRPFEVTLHSGNITETFVVTPQPVLPPERSVFGTADHTQPIIGTHEVTVSKKETPLAVEFNYATQKLLELRIVGETVELAAGHPNGLYEAYCQGRTDLKSVDIIAERVIIRSPVRLKQTLVTIRARELLFEEGGLLQTTPEEKTTSAGISASQEGLPGVDGLPAGDIVLHIANFANNSTNTVVFNLEGGRGQPGGPGRNGVDGSNLPGTYPTSKQVCDSGICKTHTAPAGFVITYWAYWFAGIRVDQGGTTALPGHGTHAKASGKPGEGGAGGSLRSTIALPGTPTTRGGASAPREVVPGGTYRGGAAGLPRKLQQIYFQLNFFTMTSVVDVSHETNAGTNAPVRSANTVRGPSGTYAATEPATAWLDPLWLRKVLNHVQSDYLANRIAPARERLADYASILDAYRLTPEWIALATATQLELGQMHDEIRLLLQRIDSGLDYFGNPAGWVPMLSFEVTKAAFEGEVDRAIEALYLTYWIGNKAANGTQLLEALSAARDQLRDDLEQAQVDYDAAVERLPVLDTAAAELENRIHETQTELSIEEQKLLDSTREEDWVIALRLSLKISAMICQMVPVYQPALGAVGQGMRLASDFDPDNPWATITNAPSIPKAYKDSPFAAAAKTQKDTKATIDPKQAETKGFDYAKALQQSSAGLRTGVADISAFIEKQKAPTDEMLAELKKLKSTSPEFKALLEKVEGLMEENLKFVQEVATTMQRITVLSDLMTHNLLAIDALNQEIAPLATALDERATVYLETMERRAHDRLLKYHYYMAKAYEYRLLTPYTQPLNLEALFEKFKEIAALDEDPSDDKHEITPAQFNTLRQVYLDIVANLAESIYDNYVSNRPELSVPIRFNLSSDELATLNADQTVALNVRDRGLIPVNHENVRVVDLKVFSMGTEVAGGGSYGSTAFVDLNMEHSGNSQLQQNGSVLLFRHYNQRTENPIVWGTRFDPVDSQLDHIRPSDASDSLLRSILSPTASSDMLLYSRPAAWADIFLTRSFFDSTGKEILLNSVRLEMVYDFVRRNDSLGRRTLEIMPAGVELPPAGLRAMATEPSIVQTGMLPLFIVDKSDVDQRRHGRGAFLRTYPTQAGMVEITAPATYGEWQFHQWADRFGRPLAGGAGANATVRVNMTQDAALMAQYILVATVPLLHAPSLQGGNIVLRWDGGSNIYLQTTATLNTSWTDVPGSAGLSQIALPLGTDRAFFRVVRR